MDVTIRKKLKAYSITAGSLTAAAAAQGQIMHTDLIPDVVIDSNAIYNLDVNNDATPELTLNAYNYIDSVSGGTYGFSLIYVIPPATNAVLGNMFMNSYPFPTALNAGDSIKPASTDWRDALVNNGDQYLSVVTPGPVYGNWTGISDKYIGIRFTIGSQAHYGWARLSVAATGDVITIKEYAYNSTPGVGIVAGQTNPLGVNEQFAGTPQVHVYDHTLFVNLPAETPVNGTLQIYNTTGQIVRTESITDPTMRIALGDLTAGVYMVQIIQPNGTVVSRKIYI